MGIIVTVVGSSSGLGCSIPIFRVECFTTQPFKRPVDLRYYFTVVVVVVGPSFTKLLKTFFVLVSRVLIDLTTAVGQGQNLVISQK